jgi:tRNA A-37 threonylcarbamoyl transferase component Bud32
MNLFAPFFGLRASTRWNGDPDVARILRESSSREIKRNRQRTVTVHDTAKGEWYVKSARVDGVRAWFREWFRGPKAKLEYDRARELTRRGVPVAEPVAWAGRLWPGPSAIVTRGEPGAVPLDQYLATLPRPHLRRRLAMSLGQFFGLTYAAGVCHPDPHPGNILVSFDDSGAPRFKWLDVHSVKLANQWSEPEILANLAFVNRWFMLRASRTDRARFWRTLRASCTGLKRDHTHELERLTLRSNLTFWARRFVRYGGDNREYRRFRFGRLSGHVVRDIPFDAFQPLLRTPDVALSGPGVRILKSSPSSTVVAFELLTPTGPKPVVLKRVPVRAWYDPFKHLVSRSSILRAWRFGQSIRDRGLPTPRPLIVFHRYFLWYPLAGYVLTEGVPDAVPLAHDPNPAYAEELGRVIRTLHDRGVEHGDLKAANVLVSHSDSPMIRVIDLVGARAGASVSRSGRVADLARLAASFHTSPCVSNGTRLRVLRAYLDTVPRYADEWKEWWRQIRVGVMAKVQRNRDRGRPL